MTNPVSPLCGTSGIGPEQFVGIRRDFIMKVDNSRPLLYPLDSLGFVLHFLTPTQGLALALLRADRPYANAQRMFLELFPQADKGVFDNLVLTADRMVRDRPSLGGIGKDGLLLVSETPRTDFLHCDPRQFVVDPHAYASVLSDPRTRTRLRTPIDILLVFTHKCFTNCRYCYAERRHVPEMPLSRWIELIDEMSNLGIHMAAPDNGDPFARTDGIRFLEYLSSKDIHFLLSTKAFVSRDHVRRLIDAGFARPVNGAVRRQVQLSFDAVDPALQRRLLRVSRPRTEGTLETFDNFAAQGIVPRIKTVVTGLNADQPRKIVDLFYGRGARTFHFTRYFRSFHRHTDDLFVRPEQTRELRRQVSSIKQDYPDVTVVEDVTTHVAGGDDLTPGQRRERWERRSGCGGGWSSLGISADGKAFLCEQMVIADPFVVGDARHQGIEAIWSSPRLEEFIHPSRQKFVGTVCHACDDFASCMWTTGRCYRDAYFAYGSIYEPPPSCPKNRRAGLRMA